jgi:hypothetical protein
MKNLQMYEVDQPVCQTAHQNSGKNGTQHADPTKNPRIIQIAVRASMLKLMYVESKIVG